MGNRAVVAFVDRDSTQPRVAVYLHWNGGPESVYAMLDVMAEHAGFVHSASYSTARFAHIACTLLADDGLSVGINQAGTCIGMGKEDNGLYLVNVSDQSVRRFKDTRGPEGVKELTADVVATERENCKLHKYWENDEIRNELRKAFAKAA